MSTLHTLLESIAQVVQVDIQRGRAPRLKPTITTDFVASYVAGAIMGVLSWWFSQENPASPEVVAAMFNQTTAALLMDE